MLLDRSPYVNGVENNSVVIYLTHIFKNILIFPRTVPLIITVVSVVYWLSRPPNTRKVASSNLAGKTLLFSFHETN